MITLKSLDSKCIAQDARKFTSLSSRLSILMERSLVLASLITFWSITRLQSSYLLRFITTSQKYMDLKLLEREDPNSMILHLETLSTISTQWLESIKRNSLTKLLKSRTVDLTGSHSLQEEEHLLMRCKVWPRKLLTKTFSWQRRKAQIQSLLKHSIQKKVINLLSQLWMISMIWMLPLTIKAKRIRKRSENLDKIFDT